MNLENKIEAQRKRMEQEKNKLDMLMKKAKIEQRKADNHRKIVAGANFETFLNEPRSFCRIILIFRFVYLFLMEKQKALIFSLYVNLEMTVYYTVWMSCCVMAMC